MSMGTYSSGQNVKTSNRHGPFAIDLCNSCLRYTILTSVQIKCVSLVLVERRAASTESERKPKVINMPNSVQSTLMRRPR